MLKTGVTLTTVLVALCLPVYGLAEDLALPTDAPPPSDVTIDSDLDGLVSNEAAAPATDYSLGTGAATTATRHYLCVPDCSKAGSEIDIKDRTSTIGRVGWGLSDPIRTGITDLERYVRGQLGYLAEYAEAQHVSVQHFITAAAVQLGPELGRRLWVAFMEADVKQSTQPATVSNSNSQPTTRVQMEQEQEQEQRDADIAANAGVMGALRDDETLDSALGATGLNADQMNGIKGLVGSKGQQIGAGGLDSRGSGLAGGGTAEGLGGLGTKGRGSGASGYGSGGYNSREQSLTAAGVTLPKFSYAQPPTTERIENDVDFAIASLRNSDLDSSALYREIQTIDNKLRAYPEARCRYHNQGDADPKLTTYFKPCNAIRTTGASDSSGRDLGEEQQLDN